MSENKHRTRNFKASIYTKVIGISEENYSYIEKNREKKSRSGMLDFIINEYKRYASEKTIS